MKIPGLGALRDKFEEKVVKIAAGRIVQALPFIPALLTWLTESPGRKRAIALVASITSIVLRHATLLIKDACGAIQIQGYELPDWCSVDPSALVVYVDAFARFADTYLVSGIDAVTILMAAWGVWHARYRERTMSVDQKDQAPTA